MSRTAYGLAVATHKQYCRGWQRVSADDPALVPLRPRLTAYGLRLLADLREADQRRYLDSARNTLARPHVWGSSSQEMLDRFWGLAESSLEEAKRLRRDADKLDPGGTLSWIEPPPNARQRNPPTTILGG